MILCIYGNGGLGREVLLLVQQINRLTHRWTDVVFVDDFNKGLTAGVRVISFAEATAEHSRDSLEVCIGIGEPALRAMLYERVSRAGVSWATLVHPSVFVPASATIGAGVIINQFSFISCGVVLGDNVFVQPSANIGHDCRIGPHSVISSFAPLGGSGTIGTRSYIGMGVPVKEGTNIGDDVIVGMGSAVLRDIESNVVALGNPARPMTINHSKRVFGR